jgi:hypothetical protein
MRTGSAGDQSVWRQKIVGGSRRVVVSPGMPADLLEHRPLMNHIRHARESRRSLITCAVGTPFHCLLLLFPKATSAAE